MNRSLAVVVAVSIGSAVASLSWSVFASSVGQPSPVAADPVVYEQIWTAVRSGAVPYLETGVEHLPVMLVPIVVIGLLSSALQASFGALWILLAIVVVSLTVVRAGSIEFVDHYQSRFATAVLPMLPLVLFRTEVFVVALVVSALVAVQRRQTISATGWIVSATLAKGWPLPLFAVLARRGAPRAAAAGAMLSTLGLLTLLVTPGFLEGRAFSGVHAETVTGNLVLLHRHVVGADLGLLGAAGAMYVDAPWSAAVVNGLLGVPLGIVAFVALRRGRGLAALTRGAGLVVLAILLSSPLFSAQFTFWLTPFAPLLAVRGRRLALLAGALSVLLVVLWDPHAVWWAVLVGLRNVAIVILAVHWVRRVAASVRHVP